MSVSFFSFGTLVGGTDGSGAPLNPAGGGGSGGGVSGEPEQFKGVLGLAVTTLSFTKTTVGFALRNTNDTNALEYSFDNVNWFICAAYQVIQDGAQIDFLYLRAVAGAPTYEVTGLLKS